MKKSSLTTGLILALLVIGAGCAKKLTLTGSQAATMSQAAADTLKTLKVFHVPFLKISDKIIHKTRQQFTEIEKGQLAEMKRTFNPIIKDTLIGRVKVVVITPRQIKAENQDKIILYIHGGGFVLGSATDRTGMLMTHELGYKTYSIDYQLAPEAKFPVAMHESLEVYTFLIKKYDPAKIVGVSTSAGSAHMLAMLLQAQALGLPMINSISLLSPAADLSPNGYAPVSNNNRDLLAYKNQADKFYVAPFIGKADSTDPFISPVYNTYKSTFPATSIVTGTRDMFLSASTRLYWKLKEAGVQTELVVGEGMWHAYTNYTDLPEAIQARKATQDFIRQQVNTTKK